MNRFKMILLSAYNKLLRKLVSTTIRSENRIFRFYKVPSGRWYVDLPEWRGGKWHLEMVSGADVLLDELCASDKDEVHVQASTKKKYKTNSLTLTKVADSPYDGADYAVTESDLGIKVKDLWLCGVTQWVYNEMPTKIYLRKVFVS